MLNITKLQLCNLESVTLIRDISVKYKATLKDISYLCMYVQGSVALKATKPEKPTKTVNLHLDCKAGIATTKAHRAMNYGSYQHETGK